MKFCSFCNRKYDINSAFCPYDGKELSMVAPDEDLVGRIIDNKYQLQEHIARGGTGAIFRALHLQLNVPIAVKVMHADRVNDVTSVERFRREAYAAMQVRHPNAIAVFDFGVTEDKLVYVVMELLSGMSLRQRLKQQCYYSIIEVNNIMQQICAAVAIAHKHNIVHRDLKPENIFLQNDNGTDVIRVLDFGLAKLRNLGENEDQSSITRNGLVVGTPLYMSPEQSRGRHVDRRSDIYSLGVILYELLTGHLPFRAQSFSALAIKHATEPPKPIYDIRPGLPGVINAVVMHALEKSPQKRPNSLFTWAAELQAAVRAVTEREFSNLFLTASDEDLEAALLLAGEPEQDDILKELFSNAVKNFTGELSQISAPAAEMSGPITQRLTRTTNALSSPAALVSEAANSLKEARNLAKVAKEKNFASMRENLLALAQETSTLLQIFIGDLTAHKPLDKAFFVELSGTVKNLKEAMSEMNQHL